jgi:hypothetical protein
MFMTCARILLLVLAGPTAAVVGLRRAGDPS